MPKESVFSPSDPPLIDSDSEAPLSLEEGFIGQDKYTIRQIWSLGGKNSSKWKTGARESRVDFATVVLFIINIVCLVAFITCVVALAARLTWTQQADGTQSPDRTAAEAQGAVAIDNPDCADMAAGILKGGGNAVEAAITGMLCGGVVQAESSGIGGGGFMTVRLSDGTVTTINFREMAPSKANKDMYHGNGTLKATGGLAVGVPGEVAGMQKAYDLFGGKDKGGNFTWKDLFQPVIDICNKTGFALSQHCVNSLTESWDALPQNIKDVYSKDGKTIPSVGDIVKRPNLAAALQAIADGGASAFYSGSIANGIVNAAKGSNGIITQDDLANYKVEVADAFKTSFNGHTFYSPPAPSGGPAFLFMLSVMDLYNHSSSSNKTLVYQRLVETFKFSFAERTWLGDPECTAQSCPPGISSEIKNRMNQLFDSSYVMGIKGKITDSATHPTEYYGPHFDTVNDHGTSHLTVLSPAGDAVSVTTTVNSYFGSKLMTNDGIVLNNHMDDFAAPGIIDGGFPPSSLNYIYPGRRPLSSVCPSIAVKTMQGLLTEQGADQDNKVSLLIGASGGKQIPTGTAQAILNLLTFDETLDQSIETGRLHEQLKPDIVTYEEKFADPGGNIINYLKNAGNNVTMRNTPFCVVQGIRIRPSDGCVEAHGDSRKGGKGVVVNDCQH